MLLGIHYWPTWYEVWKSLHMISIIRDRHMNCCFTCHVQLVTASVKILLCQNLSMSTWYVMFVYSNHVLYRFWFLPTRRYASAGLCDSDVSVCLSVCLSICHTPVLCLAQWKQDREMYTIWYPHDSSFWRGMIHQKIRKVSPQRNVPNEGVLGFFGDFRPICRHI